MEMFDNWVRLKIWTPSSTVTLMGPDGQPVTGDPQGEDTYFEVIECGPEVETVEPGDVMVCSFLQGMFRFQLPGENFKSFALKETEFLGRVLRGSPAEIQT